MTVDVFDSVFCKYTLYSLHLHTYVFPCKHFLKSRCRPCCRITEPSQETKTLRCRLQSAQWPVTRKHWHTLASIKLIHTHVCTLVDQWTEGDGGRVTWSAWQKCSLPHSHARTHARRSTFVRQAPGHGTLQWKWHMCTVDSLTLTLVFFFVCFYLNFLSLSSHVILL